MVDGVTVIHGNCLSVMRGMADGSVDAIVTDPPWMDYRSNWFDRDEWTEEAWYNPIVEVDPRSYAPSLFRLLRDDSACLLWCRWDCFSAYADAMSDTGFVVRNCVVWDKGQHTAGDLEGNLGFRHEMAVFATKGRWKRHGKREVNLWAEKHLFPLARRDHPSEKPLRLMRRSVELTCPPGGLVLDPFVGSGTTLEACLKTGRRGIGIEVDARYFPAINRRLESAATPLFSALTEP